jgi:hypothetical protein
LQWIPQRVIEAKTIDRLPAFRGEVKISSTVRSRGTENRHAILGAIRYAHVWDWSAGRVKDDAFESLSKLRLFDNYEFSNSLCRSDEQCARERDCYHLTHRTIIGQ